MWRCTCVESLVTRYTAGDISGDDAPQSLRMKTGLQSMSTEGGRKRVSRMSITVLVCRRAAGAGGRRGRRGRRGRGRRVGAAGLHHVLRAAGARAAAGLLLRRAVACRRPALCIDARDPAFSSWGNGLRRAIPCSAVFVNHYFSCPGASLPFIILSQRPLWSGFVAQTMLLCAGGGARAPGPVPGGGGGAGARRAARAGVCKVARVQGHAEAAAADAAAARRLHSIGQTTMLIQLH